MLEILGVSEVEERLYRALLGRRRATVTELGQATRLPALRVRAALVGLESKGLASRLPGSRARFVAVPPQVGIQVLIRQREAELERARELASDLAAAFGEFWGDGPSDPTEIVEVVVGSEAVLQRFRQLQEGAREEFLVFDKPPYVASPPGQNIPVEVELLRRRRLRYRAIYDRASLEFPGQLEWLEQVIAAGEEARVVAELPMKMAIADRRVGLVPLNVTEPDVRRGGIVVRSSALLEALVALFDRYWELGTEIRLPASALPQAGEDQAGTGVDQRLLALLAGGLKDEAVARQLGMSLRTMRRRVAVVMGQLGARTRFQAGALAVKRGWL